MDLKVQKIQNQEDKNYFVNQQKYFVLVNI